MLRRVLIGFGSFIVVLGVAVDRTVNAAPDTPATAEKAAKEKTEAEKPAAEKPKKAKPEKSAKKPAGQLPPYFSGVIDEDQRDKVVSTYAKFNTKLTKLKDEIKTLTADRDKALEDLLTDEQKAKLAQLKADAKAKRAKTAK